MLCLYLFPVHYNVEYITFWHTNYWSIFAVRAAVMSGIKHYIIWQCMSYFYIFLWRVRSAVLWFLCSTPGHCFARYTGFLWGSRSPIKWFFWLTMCRPQPLQHISASWYRPMHHLGLCALPMLIVPHIHTKLARRAFSVAAASTWNSLPADIRLYNNILTFKRHLKTNLFKLT